MARRIITYSTLGDNMKEVFSSARTLGELQPELTAAGIRFDGMKLMTNPGQVTLESLQAELPEGEFQLFIMPQKVKSGTDDSYLIDEEDGISWNSVDWTEESEIPEDYSFRSAKDLAIARSKKAFHYLNKAIEHFANTTSAPATGVRKSGDPMLDNLRNQAAELQKNMNIFG